MTRLPDTLHRLDDVLGDLVRALESGRAEAVLAVEAPLAAAVAELTSIDPETLPIDADARRQLAPVVDALRAHLVSAVRMGHSSAALLATVVGGEAYGPTGRQA